MAQLKNLTKNVQVASEVQSANNVFTRMRGLLGKTSLPLGTTLFIPRCSSIHTVGMKFPMDAVFVDRGGVVRRVYRNIRPWRLIGPVWGAWAVYEFMAGHLPKEVEIGDRLHVGD